MKTKCAWLVLSLSLGFGTIAAADTEWGFFGSYWTPSDGDEGVGAGIKIGIEMVERVQLDVRYAFISDVIDTSEAQLDVDPLEFGFSFAIPVAENIEPYIGIGAGYYFMDGEVDGPVEADVDDEFGFYLSAGLEWILSRSGAQYGQTSTKLFIEAIYRVVEASDMKVSSGSAELEDADLNGLGLQAGFLIGW